MSSFSGSSSIRDLSAHSRVFPEERDEAMLHEKGEEEEERKWQKIGDAELTVKHGRRSVVVLWKCSLFSSAQWNLSTGTLTSCT